MSDLVATFARAALLHAQHSLQSAQLTWFSVAGVNIGLAETTPHLVQWIAGQFDLPNGTGPRIFCDTSGWHLPHTAALGDLSEASPLELDGIFKAAGLFGSHDARTNQWDIFDPEGQIGVRLLPTPDLYPEWEATAPLSNLLGWVMRSKGRMVMHAASLGHNGNGVLLAGPGGRGKSGTTLAGVVHGLQSVGDDYCVVSSAETIKARPFYRSMKQDPKGLSRVGISGAALSGGLNWQGKHVFDMRELHPDAVVDQLAIHAVLLPEIAHAPSTGFRPASAFETLHALAPSTMLQLSGDRTATFKACANVSRTVPGFHLSLSEDPAEIASAIKAFIRSLTT